ncbi:homeobox-leucine zipper protein ROC5-like [Bidens hawaiensis]|uniref:homeobox-leucine zipper protein ROC5-like n=1 Tax=Bidens hawaiensis TaxID=980011 RepID=UPI00404AF0B9
MSKQIGQLAVDVARFQKNASLLPSDTTVNPQHSSSSSKKGNNVHINVNEILQGVRDGEEVTTTKGNKTKMKEVKKPPEYDAKWRLARFEPDYSMPKSWMQPLEEDRARSNFSLRRAEGNENQRAREEIPAITSDVNENFEASSDEQEIHSSSSRRAQYTRHTPYQTEELEKYFEKNAHPDDKERKEIGRKLGIDIKKAQTERHENSTLRKQNEQMKLELLALQEVAKKHFAPDHSSATSRLPNNITYPSETSKKDQEGGSYTYGSLDPMEAQLQMGINIPIQRSGYLEQASRAMEELLKIGLVNAPLWNRNMQGGGETLNFEEYAKAFLPCLGKKPRGFVSDATRASSVVPMSSSTLVEALLDARIVYGHDRKLTTMEVISNGIGGSRNGALQLMKAEIQLISPVVPVRAFKFIRFAKQEVEGIWVVVDLSVDYGLEGHLTRRCPSGCILRDIPNGFSMVTWIEHVEYNEQSISHQYRQLIRPGVGFGAQRWIGALLRHCEGLSAATSPTLHPDLYQHLKISLHSLARRMTSIFCAGVCLTGGQHWESVASASGRPRIMARKCITGFGEPFGIVLSATYSVWIPANHQRLFDLLLTKDLRCLWDVIYHRIATENMIHFPLSEDESSPNCISILNSNTSAEDNQIMVLQETSGDMTGSLIVYATVDSQTVSMVMSGEDTSSVALLPSGYALSQAMVKVV